MARKVLLLGAGSSKLLTVPTPLVNVAPEITTVDIERSHKPDCVWDLNKTPWPFPNDSYDEIHAYEVLEHLGQQGDAPSFFAHFGEIYRILNPMGYLAGSVPQWESMWAWGDPSHRRVINEGSFAYLDQTKYTQIGITTMTDFRSIWKGDFSAEGFQRMSERLFFILKAHKPARA